MTPRKHARILAQAVVVWLGFWVLGLPSYYQQYPTLAMAIAMILLSVATSLAAIVLLRPVREEARMSRAFWLSFYFTVPFAVLDALYCAWYLGHGLAFLYRYWYLTIFYITPWLTFMPTAALLRGSPTPGPGARRSA